MTPEKRYVLDTLSRYWPTAQECVGRLPVFELAGGLSNTIPPKLKIVELPDWANNLAVDGGLLVPESLVATGENAEWERTDWVQTAFWYLNGTAERGHESVQGPIHSYSLKLKGWDERLWQRAWVNRIALFFRRWTARQEGASETDLFGPLPECEIVLTHDVDAVEKTWAIRFKQAAFHAFNASRSVLNGRWNRVPVKLSAAMRFLVSDDDYWCFDDILDLENQSRVKSVFLFNGGAVCGSRDLKQQLLDPTYDVLNPRLKKTIRDLYREGWEIGLHPSFDTWNDEVALRREKSHVEEAVSSGIDTCRQHWLRFSWESTWKAQEAVGFTRDMTLGFNNRPAFRNGAALPFHPWDPKQKAPMALMALPMVLMDSHLYDYADLAPEGIAAAMQPWIDEIKSVRGCASIIWHQRVFGRDYGWGDGYRALLAGLPASP